MSATTIDLSRIGYSTEIFEQFLATRTEPAWITDARRVAFATYHNLLQEDLDPEEFKRVDLRVFNAGKFRPSTDSGDTAGIDTLLSDKTEFGGAISHVNGQCTRSTVSDVISAQGVLFGELATMLTSHRELLEPYFMKQAVQPGRGSFLGMACRILDGRNFALCSAQCRSCCRCTA
jgi:Fe-S cluster assembly protein SufD